MARVAVEESVPESASRKTQGGVPVLEAIVGTLLQAVANNALKSWRNLQFQDQAP